MPRFLTEIVLRRKASTLLMLRELAAGVAEFARLLTIDVTRSRYSPRPVRDPLGDRLATFEPANIKIAASGGLGFLFPCSRSGPSDLRRTTWAPTAVFCFWSQQMARLH